MLVMEMLVMLNVNVMPSGAGADSEVGANAQE